MEIHRKIKVCHVINRLDIGGMENGVVNLCNKLDRSKFSPIICCLKGIGPMAQRLQPHVKVVDMKFKEGKAPFRPLILAGFFRKIKPDVVHTHSWGGGSYSGILGAKLANVPVIINGEHGTFYLKPHQVFIQRILAFLCNDILSVSHSLKRRLKTEVRISPNRVSVIPNGVDVEIFHGNYNSAPAKTKLPSDTEKSNLRIGCIGSIKPQKNQIMLIKAVELLKDNNSIENLKVMFVGDGPDREKLEQFVNNAGLSNHVEFLGRRNDIHLILASIDILVSTSLSKFEGMSNIILEAMSSGVPVIATNSVGTSELIKDGINGFLIESNDISKLAEKIELLSKNQTLLKSMARIGRNIIHSTYSIARMISSYEHIYIKRFKV